MPPRPRPASRSYLPPFPEVFVECKVYGDNRVLCLPTQTSYIDFETSWTWNGASHLSPLPTFLETTDNLRACVHALLCESTRPACSRPRRVYPFSSHIARPFLFLPPSPIPEWLLLPVAICDLPRDACMALTIYDCAGPGEVRPFPAAPSASSIVVVSPHALCP